MSDAPSLNQKLDPTSAVSKFYKALIPYAKTKGFALHNLGQGVATAKPDDILNEVMGAPAAVTCSEIYPVTGGKPKVQQAASDWASRFFGLTGHTFVFPVQSRASLKTFFEFVGSDARKENKPAKVALGHLHWTMIDEHLEDLGLEGVHYDMTPSGLYEPVKSVLSDDIQGIYIDTTGKNNPVGIQHDAKDVAKTFQYIEEQNLWRAAHGQKPMRLLVDLPYFMSCKQTNDIEKPYLDAGLDNVLSGHMITPWAVSISFSKAYGMATPGAHMTVVNPKYAEDFGSRVHRSWGDAMIPEYEAKLVQLLDSKYDRPALAHFDKELKNFSANRALVEAMYPDMVVPGEANLLMLTTMPKEYFDGGKVIQGEHENMQYHIENLNDLINYAGREKGVVFVNNGFDKAGNSLARISLAPRNETAFKPAIEAFDSAIQALKSAPTI